MIKNLSRKATLKFLKCQLKIQNSVHLLNKALLAVSFVSFYLTHL